jgi:hypothetical protein
MKTTLAWMGGLLLAAVAVSFATADHPPCPPAPVCDPGCQTMPCPDPCCDPCDGLDPCKLSCNPFKKWFHHDPKVKEVKVKEVKQPKANGPDGINSPVFPVHPFARGPRDFFMVDP